MSSSSSPSSVRIVVLASGSGSNFQALLDAVSSSKIQNAEIVRLFVNRKAAYAVTRAEKAGVPSEYFNMVSGGFQPKGEKDPVKLKEARQNYDAVLAEKVLQQSPDLIVLAGWMHVFTEGFLVPVAEKRVRIINLHPALPGKFCPLCSSFVFSLRLAYDSRPLFHQVQKLIPWRFRQENTTAPAPSSAHTEISRQGHLKITGRAL